MFVGAMNPCPCGFLTDPKKQCICSAKDIEKYRSRLSGPLVDRIDIFIEVPKVETDKFGQNARLGETSKEIKAKVEKARLMQLKRFT
jgi:magnesium chelatase family protein